MLNQKLLKWIAMGLLVIGINALVYAQDSGDDGGDFREGDSDFWICSSCETPDDARALVADSLAPGDSAHIYNPVNGYQWTVTRPAYAPDVLITSSPDGQHQPPGGSSGGGAGGGIGWLGGGLGGGLGVGGSGGDCYYSDGNPLPGNPSYCPPNHYEALPSH